VVSHRCTMLQRKEHMGGIQVVYQGLAVCYFYGAVVSHRCTMLHPGKEHIGLDTPGECEILAS